MKNQNKKAPGYTKEKKNNKYKHIIHLDLDCADMIWCNQIFNILKSVSEATIFV